MTLQKTLISRIETYCADHGLSDRDFGYAAVQDGRLVERLRQNLGTLKLVARVEAYLINPPPAQRKRAQDTQPIQSAVSPL
jgi:hypothetical protein